MRKRPLAQSSEEWEGKTAALPPVLIGGQLTSMDVCIWAEARSGAVLTAVPEPSGTPGMLAKAFDLACRRPGIGQPRLPARVAVSTPDAKLEMAARYPSLSIIVRPVPQVDEALEDMIRQLGFEPADDPTLGGNVSRLALDELQSAGVALWKAAPWRYLGDTELFLIDAPGQRFHGGALSVHGAAGELFGFAMYSSAHEFDRRYDYVVTAEHDGAPLTETVVFSIDAWEELSDRVKSVAHRSPALGGRYATVFRAAGPDSLTPHDERDVFEAAAVARALAQWTGDRSAALTAGTVRLRPIGIDPARQGPTPAALDPAPPPDPALGRWLEVEASCLPRLAAFAATRDVEFKAETRSGLWLFLALFHECGQDGLTDAEAWVTNNTLSEDEETWVVAHEAASTRPYRIGDLVAGNSLRLMDILTGQVVVAYAPQIAHPRHISQLLLARVVTIRGATWIAAMDPRLLIGGAEPMIREVLAASPMRLPKKKYVTDERLQHPMLPVTLMEMWRMAGGVAT